MRKMWLVGLAWLGIIGPGQTLAEADAAQVMAAEATSLRERLPADALAYLRIPHLWGMLTPDDTGVLKGTLKHPAYVKAMKHLTKAVDKNLLQKLGNLTHPGVSLLLSHARSPLEVAVLLPDNVPPMATTVLLSVQLDFASIGALNALVNDIAAHTPGMQIHSEFSADGVALLSLTSMSIAGAYDTNNRTLTLLTGIAVTPDSFKRITADLKAGANPMQRLEARVDDTGTGLFQWLNVARLWPMLRAAIPADEAAEMERWGLFELRALALGWGRTEGRGRLRLVLDMPKAGYRERLPAIANPLDFDVSGEADLIMGLALPMRALFELVEIVVQEQVSESDREQYETFKHGFRQEFGLELADMVQALGEEITVLFDDAGEFIAVRIKPSPEQDKFFDFIRREVASLYETREMDGVVYHHLVVPQLQIWEHKPVASPSSSLEVWLNSVFAKLGSHLYWVREGDYVIAAELPQMLIDRTHAKQRTPMSTWLKQQRREDFSHALFYLSIEVDKAPRKLYHSYLAILQMLADLSGAPYDPFALPTAREMKLPDTSAYSVQLDMSDDLLMAGVNFDTSSLEFLFDAPVATAAVVGVMAAVAIPAYTDYLRRSKVAEAVGLLAGMKTPAEEFFFTKGHLPTPEEIGAKTRGKYTKELRLRDGGDGYEATLKDPEIPGKVVLLFDAAKTTWRCTSEGMDPKYLPSWCR